jgi:hypothetical protein
MSSKISENVSEDLMKILNPSHSNSKNLQSDIAVAIAAKQQVHNLTKDFNSKKIKKTEDVVKDTEESNSAKVSFPNIGNNDLDKEQSNIATDIVPNVENNDKDKEQPNSPTKIISNIGNNDNKEYDDECEDTITDTIQTTDSSEGVEADPEKSSTQEGGVNKKTKKRMRSGSRSTRGRKTFTQKVYSE